MKKIFALVLSVVMILSLCACASGGEEAAKGLEVGFGREKIHPENPVPLGGYGNTEYRIGHNPSVICLTISK